VELSTEVEAAPVVVSAVDVAAGSGSVEVASSAKEIECDQPETIKSIIKTKIGKNMATLNILAFHILFQFLAFYIVYRQVDQSTF
jgi:hypothetical protein